MPHTPGGLPLFLLDGAELGVLGSPDVVVVIGRERQRPVSIGDVGPEPLHQNTTHAGECLTSPSSHCRVTQGHATVQATIAARIDRLDPGAKSTLNAAAVGCTRPELSACVNPDHQTQHRDGQQESRTMSVVGRRAASP